MPSIMRLERFARIHGLPLEKVIEAAFAAKLQPVSRASDGTAMFATAELHRVCAGISGRSIVGVRPGYFSTN